MCAVQVRQQECAAMERPLCVMRLNRAPAVGVHSPPHRSQGDLSAQLSSDGPAPSELLCRPQSSCAARVKGCSAAHSAPMKAAASSADHRSQSRRGLYRNRAEASHLSGGAVFVTDGPSLIFAGRGPRQGRCAAAVQHVHLFRPPDAVGRACAPAGACQRAKLAMLRGSGPLW
uniref:Uncharacterized protein n=1 Tax=Trypanosoma congolense (strain IL3000) TaxID=1068625 RepID=G0UMH9_TRYCI|nr:conserved hypothetical protein [Trypanosoma congolense IL3000]